jgi:hypothetical protein
MDRLLKAIGTQMSANDVAISSLYAKLSREFGSLGASLEGLSEPLGRIEFVPALTNPKDVRLPVELFSPRELCVEIDLRIITKKRSS